MCTFVICDGDLVLLAGALVSRADVQDAIGVNVEGHVDLRNASGGWGDPAELKFPQNIVVSGHGSFTLIHLAGN